MGYYGHRTDDVHEAAGFLTLTTIGPKTGNRSLFEVPFLASKRRSLAHALRIQGVWA